MFTIYVDKLEFCVFDYLYVDKKGVFDNILRVFNA